VTVQDLDERSRLPVIEIFASESDFDEMASDPPKSAKRKYYPARLRYPDGELRSIKLRFRGRSFWHFHREKPSIRLKLPEQDMLHLKRAVNLINPEDRAMMSNPLGELLARKLGVLAPRTDLVRVMLNGEFLGVYHRTTHEDSAMLRENKRANGTFFTGDHLKRRWQPSHFKSLSTTSEVDFEPLVQMIDAMYAPLSRASLDSLWENLSMTKFAAWQAAMNLVGGVHTDFVHNNLFFFDSSTERLEPVVSDINGHGLQTAPKEGERINIFRGAYFNIPLNERMHPLFDRAIRDPRFLHLRNQFLHLARTSVGSVTAQIKLVKELYAAIAVDVHADKNKGAIELAFIGWYRFPFGNSQFVKSVERLKRWIFQRERFLKEKLYDVSVSATIIPQQKGKSLVELAVDGNSSVTLNLEELDDAVSYELVDGTIVSSKGSTASVLLSPGLQVSSEAPHPSLQLNREPQHVLAPAPQYYRLYVLGSNKEQITAALRRGVHHALTSEPVNVSIKEASSDYKLKLYNTQVLHGWDVIPPQPGTVQLGPGKVDLSESLNVPSGQQLVVPPETTLRIRKGVAVEVYGSLEIEGALIELEEGAQVVLRATPFERMSRISDSQFSGLGSSGEAPLLKIVGGQEIKIERSRFELRGSRRVAIKQSYGRVKLDEFVAFGCANSCIVSEYGEIKLSKARFVDVGDVLVVSGGVGNLQDVSVQSVVGNVISVKYDADIRVDSLTGSDVGAVASVSDSVAIAFEGVQLSGCQNPLSYRRERLEFVQPIRVSFVGKSSGWGCVASLPVDEHIDYFTSPKRESELLPIGAAQAQEIVAPSVSLGR
jgi:hypothetical protein